MEINGCDFRVDRVFTIFDILAEVKKHWPMLIFEQFDNEFFIYKDKSAMLCWEDDKWQDLNDLTMLSVIFDEKYITFVIDSDKINQKIIQPFLNYSGETDD